MRKDRRGTCEFLVIASAFFILHSEFSLLHSDFRLSPVISRRKPLDLPYDHADPQRSCESFLRLSALCHASADLLARVGRRSVCHGPAGEQTILLDIGAVWCHWCHVMDRESYDDPEIAQLVNERFVAVKVER